MAGWFIFAGFRLPPAAEVCCPYTNTGNNHKDAVFES